MAMSRLERSERRFDELLRKTEIELSRAAKSRADASRHLEMVQRIEQRTESAIRQLRDIIRQGEGGAHG